MLEAQSVVNPVDQHIFDPDQPVVFDRHIWIEVAEYLIAVAGVIALVWLIVDVIASPLWGGLTSIRLR